jgi:hypothetical protein
MPYKAMIQLAFDRESAHYYSHSRPYKFAILNFTWNEKFNVYRNLGNFRR